MKAQEPIPHWNNFTIPELKEILKHSRALERLGIAQDEEMIFSLERDITLREKKLSAPRYSPFQSKPARITQRTVKQIHVRTSKKQQPQEYLLAPNV